MAKQRIEYIDAMRGFTMILVVFAHVCHFCFGDSRMGYNVIFILFRLPCFFMLSGWLFEPASRNSFKTVARHKAMVQLVPTFIFLLLLAPPPEFFHQLGALKGGYWFTFVLFEFFILYMLIARAGKYWTPILAFLITIASFIYARYYDSIKTSSESYQLLIINALGFLSVTTWRLFLFFYIGTWIRRHFDAFIRWTSKPAVFFLICAAFFLIASTSHKDYIWYEMFRYYAGGVSGMIMIFAFFRFLYISPFIHHSCSIFHLPSSIFHLPSSIIPLPSSLFHHPSSILQYVGTRTLDIYLLHYFFLPRFLMDYAPQLYAYDSRLLEFIIIMAISLIVLVLCLITSYVIRLSPFLGHYLFGVKY